LSCLRPLLVGWMPLVLVWRGVGLYSEGPEYHLYELEFWQKAWADILQALGFVFEALELLFDALYFPLEGFGDFFVGLNTMIPRRFGNPKIALCLCDPLMECMLPCFLGATAPCCPI